MNRRAFLAALAGLPLVGRLVPRKVVPRGFYTVAAVGLDVYIAAPGTPWPKLSEKPDERWTLIRKSESRARGASGLNR